MDDLECKNNSNVAKHCTKVLNTTLNMQKFSMGEGEKGVTSPGGQSQINHTESYSVKYNPERDRYF